MSLPIIAARPLLKTVDPRFDYISKNKDGDTKAIRLIKAGKVKPHGARLLVRCIMPDEASTFDSGARDARNALAFEVIAIGNGCAAHYDAERVNADDRIKVGDHCQSSIAVVDRLNKDAADTLYYTLPLEMVDAFWSPDDDPDASASRT